MRHRVPLHNGKMQQKGGVERKNGHLLEVTRAFISQNNAAKPFWGETVLIASHLINHLSSRVPGFKSPMETMSLLNPNVLITIIQQITCKPEINLIGPNLRFEKAEENTAADREIHQRLEGRLIYLFLTGLDIVDTNECDQAV